METLGLPRNLVILLLLITLSALPISRLFQWWSPPTSFILGGGLLSILSLPIVVKACAVAGFITCSKDLLHMAMLFSPFLFASSIDMVLSLENDGLLANYMAFYMKDGEQYLMTPYGTAICYWDGAVHFALYWAMLYSFNNGKDCFRSLSVYWFGTFFSSMIVLIIGALIGPFPVYSAIILNVLYIFVPWYYLWWVVSSTTSHKTVTVPFSLSSTGSILRWLFTFSCCGPQPILFYVAYLSYFLELSALGLKITIALGANREIIQYIGSAIEKPISHPHRFNHMAMMVFLFYGVPCTVYSLYCLLLNMKTPLLVDVSMLFAGLTANMQVTYIGPYLIRKPEDKLEFSNTSHWWIFWISNWLMFIVPHLFALYCYNFYPSRRSKTSPPSSKIVTRSRSKLTTYKDK
ncbi:TM6SF2 [Bugula neritina]|uniref:TM6SF2 n=1 Tax=Bugula neritina TaxID=10212 RepID=A0A7J7KQD9_BUGNE|nr:TM6SF2 [Bugula neritina]